MVDWKGLPVGTHLCCWFDGPQQRRRTVAEFVAAGLARDERVAVFSARAAISPLDPSDRAFADAVDSGQILLAVAEDAYFHDGDFDGSTRVAEFVALVRETMSAGYSALRVFADNGGMPSALPNPELWLEYEMRVASTIPQFPLIGLCGFSVDDPPALPVNLLDAVHEHNATAQKRPSTFHFRGRHDGSFALGGALRQDSLHSFRRLISAAEPVLNGNYLSLQELEAVDAAAAHALHELTRDSAFTIWGAPPFLRDQWVAQGLTPSTSPPPRLWPGSRFPPPRAPQTPD